MMTAEQRYEEELLRVREVSGNGIIVEVMHESMKRSVVMEVPINDWFTARELLIPKEGDETLRFEEYRHYDWSEHPTVESQH